MPPVDLPGWASVLIALAALTIAVAWEAHDHYRGRR